MSGAEIPADLAPTDRDELLRHGARSLARRATQDTGMYLALSVALVVLTPILRDHTALGLGTILGKLLAESGGAEVIARRLISRLGPQRIHWTMLLIAFLVGIPVWFTVGLVLLVPILFTLVKESGKPMLNRATRIRLQDANGRQGARMRWDQRVGG